MHCAVVKVALCYCLQYIEIMLYFRTECIKVKFFFKILYTCIVMFIDNENDNVH